MKKTNKSLVFLVLLLCPVFIQAGMFGGMDNPPGLAPGSVCLQGGVCSLSSLNVTQLNVINETMTDYNITTELNVEGVSNFYDNIYMHYNNIFNANKITALDWSNISGTTDITSLPSLNVNASQIEDVWVNITGDTMTGNLSINVDGITDDVELRLTSESNKHSYLYIMESNIFGFRLWNDGSGTNKFKFDAIDNNIIKPQIWFDRDTGDIDFFANIDMNGNNITADYFYGSGAYLSDLNVSGNVSVGGDLDMSGYRLTTNYLDGLVGSMDMRGDPWWLGGTDLQIAQDLIVDGNVSIDENLDVIGNIKIDTGDDSLTRFIGVKLADNRFIKMGNAGGDDSSILIDNNDKLKIGHLNTYDDIYDGINYEEVMEIWRGGVTIIPDLIVDGKVSIGGDLTLEGDLNMSNNSITDVDVLYVHNITGRSPIYISNELILAGGITGDGSGLYNLNLSNSSSASYVERGGDIMTGNLGIKMTPSYELDVNGTIRALNNMVVGNNTPAAGFSGLGDLYAFGSIKSMEGLYTEAISYGAGLEVSNNDLIITSLNIFSANATLNATSRILYDSEANFDSSYNGQFLKIFGSTGISFSGATGQITAVVDSTHIELSFATAGSDIISDATGMLYVIYPAPNLFVGDNGVVIINIGENKEANFEVNIPNGTGFTGAYIYDVAGADQHQALTIDVDSKDYDGIVGLNIFMSSSTGVSDIISNAILLEGDATGFNNSFLHFLDISLLGAGIGNDIDVIHIGGLPAEGHIIHVGEPSELDKAYYDDTATTINITADVISTDTNTNIFENDNSIVYVGNSGNFTSIGFSLNTESSRNLRLEYLYCDGAGVWKTIPSVVDTTNGMKTSGTISITNPIDRGQCNQEIDGTPFVDITEYSYVAVRRTKNYVQTTPIVSSLSISGGAGQFLLGTEYMKLIPVDTEPISCDATTLGAIYFDKDNDFMCVCRLGGWFQMNDGSTSCS